MAEHESNENIGTQSPTPGIDAKTGRVSSDYLSCEIPKGWVATVNGPDALYAFEMHPEGTSDEDGVEILCIRMSPYPQEMCDVAIPETLLALKRAPFFSLDNANVPFLAKPLDYYEVEGQGCRCAVMQVRVWDNQGFEFYIYQDGSRGDWLRATFYSWDEDQLDKARAIVNELASSICAPRMEPPVCIRAFQECLDSKVEPERFRELAKGYVKPLLGTFVCLKSIFEYIASVYKSDQRSESERQKAGLVEFTKFNEDAVPYLEHVMDAVDAQARYYEEGGEQLEEIHKAAAEIVDTVLVTHKSFEDLPDPKLFTLSERVCALLSRAGLEDDESSRTERSNTESSMRVQDPAVMISLLSSGYVFFDKDDISWSKSKGHHAVKGLQIDGSKLDAFQALAVRNGFDDANDMAQCFIAFMQKLEEDEQLVIPREHVSKSLSRIIRRGDLTGLTFANLAGARGAFSIRSTEPNTYLVMSDPSLVKGIPCFYDMMCRLIWDLRQCMKSLKGVPFQVTFTGCLNFDLKSLLRGYTEPVPGAQMENPGVVTVDEEPKFDLERAIAERSNSVADLLRADGTEYGRDLADVLDRIEAEKNGEPEAEPEPVAEPESVAESESGPEPEDHAESEPAPKPTSAVAAKAAHLQELLNLIISRRAEVTKAQEEESNDHDRCWNEHTELDKLTARREGLVSKINSTREKADETSKKLEDTLRKREEELARRERLAKNQATLLSAKANVGAELSPLEEKYEEKKTELDSMLLFAFLKKRAIKDELHRLAPQVKEVRGHLGEIEENLEKVTRALERSDELLSSSLAPRSIKKTEQRLQGLNDRLESLSAELEEVRREIRNCRQRLRSAKKKIDNSKVPARKSQLQEALDRYNAFIDALSFTPEEKQDGEYDELRQSMDSTLSQLRELGIVRLHGGTSSFPKLAVKKRSR